MDLDTHSFKQAPLYTTPFSILFVCMRVCFYVCVRASMCTWPAHMAHRGKFLCMHCAELYTAKFVIHTAQHSFAVSFLLGMNIERTNIWDHELIPSYIDFWIISQTKIHLEWNELTRMTRSVHLIWFVIVSPFSFFLFFRFQYTLSWACELFMAVNTE